MIKETNISRLAFWTFSIVTILISGIMTFINLNEFFVIGILKETYGYPFGGEGPTAYYYKSAELYSTVVLIWGLLFLSTLIVAIKATIKSQFKLVIWVFAVTLILLLAEFVHGQI